MEEHHNSFLQTGVGFFGILAGFFLKYETLIHNVAASISLYGGTVLVIGGLINMFTGWSVSGWVKKHIIKRRHKK